jgi:probable biosynthetic protein (TIGR04099 family)
MNSLLPPIEVKRLHRWGSPGTAASAPVRDAVVLGMPHLCTNGLSETWLLKECGHRHWLLLAEAAGLAAPDFRDPAGDPIYAAFLSVSVRDAAFDTVREHDRLVFASRLARISRTRFMSAHRLVVSGRPVGEIAMISTFVRRAQRGKNHGIARIEVPALRGLELDHESVARAAEITALRSNHWDAHLGFERSKATVIDRFLLDPCPGQDFNGADFLYFASFLAFVDRAEWSFFRQQVPLPTTRRRDIVYRRNIDLGERVVASLLQFRWDAQSLDHWCRLEREHDGQTIAEIFTARALATSR